MSQRIASALVGLLFVTAPAAVFAQNAAAPVAPPPTVAAPQQDDPRKNQKVERIHVEDEAVNIDETRYAGRTENITVQPKNGMPSYEILPANPARSRIDDRRGTSGDRVWNVFSF